MVFHQQHTLSQNKSDSHSARVGYLTKISRAASTAQLLHKWQISAPFNQQRPEPHRAG
jgi:hypothetical protein